MQYISIPTPDVYLLLWAEKVASGTLKQQWKLLKANKLLESKNIVDAVLSMLSPLVLSYRSTSPSLTRKEGCQSMKTKYVKASKKLSISATTGLQ
jgi:hypothetical protein